MKVVLNFLHSLTLADIGLHTNTLSPTLYLVKLVCLSYDLFCSFRVASMFALTLSDISLKW